MDTLKELVDLYQTYAEEFIVWGHGLKIICVRRPNLAVSIRLERVIETIVQFSKYLLCEGYCFYLDYLQIAYYPASNRITRSLQGDRFPPVQRSTILSLGENESRHMAGLSVSHLVLLHKNFRIPEFIRDEKSRRTYPDEESLLQYVT